MSHYKYLLAHRGKLGLEVESWRHATFQETFLKPTPVEFLGSLGDGRRLVGPGYGRPDSWHVA